MSDVGVDAASRQELVVLLKRQSWESVVPGEQDGSAHPGGASALPDGEETAGLQDATVAGLLLVPPQLEGGDLPTGNPDRIDGQQEAADTLALELAEVLGDGVLTVHALAALHHVLGVDVEVAPKGGQVWWRSGNQVA